MKKKYMMPLQRIAELDPKDALLQSVSVGIGEDEESDEHDSDKVKEEWYPFNSNGNIWDNQW